MDVTQPPEPLGDCYNLGDLERTIRRAISRYGDESCEIKGFTLSLHFPKGQKPNVIFTKIDVAYSDNPPEDMV
jgi:hypothetical protein